MGKCGFKSEGFIYFSCYELITLRETFKMRSICLYFQIHQPLRLKRYRFFNIGNDHYYYDDYLNESVTSRLAERSYLRANKLILKMIKDYGKKFKIAFSISGITLDQFELYAPEVIESFQKLAATGCVEFLAETYSHSLVSLKNKDEFGRQVKNHVNKIKSLFGQEPRVFRNTELIYSDGIGKDVAEMGFTAMLTEGAKHILGWKSPNYLYCNAINPRLKLILRNFRLSDDIAFRFSNRNWSEFPLTTDKFVQWLNKMEKKEETVNIFIDYETFGEHQWMESGIFEFLSDLPGKVYSQSDFVFRTPSELAASLMPVSSISVPYPVSWADEERDITAWLGNELQNDAFNRLYTFTERVNRCGDSKLLKDWDFLQASDHFYYMSTKFFSDGAIPVYYNPYDSPYDAYINYMNVLSDFGMRLHNIIPENGVNQDVTRLTNIINEKDDLLKKYEAELKKLKGTKTKAAVSKKKISPVRKKASA
jgi:alpha-amylase